MIAANSRTAASAYASLGPTEYRNPPTTGPTIDAAVNVAVQSAMICGNNSVGASSGAIERRDGASIASAAPNANAIRNSGHTVPGSIWLYTTSATAHATRPSRNSPLTRRRSNRSATHPLTSTSSTAGTNCARPMNPMSSALPEMSKVCLNSTVTRRLRAVAASAVDSRYRRTAGYRRTSRALATPAR